MLLHRDCVFYLYEGNLDWEHIRNQEDNFCVINYGFYQNNILEASVEWIDSIKVKDKIIASTKKKIIFYVYEKNKVICIFGGSESQIAYAIAKLVTNFHISLNKVDTFRNYKDYFLNPQSEQGFKLTSIDVSKRSTGRVNNSYINIPIKEINEKEMKDVLQYTEALVVYYEGNSVYFVIDSNSVVSFFNTDEHQLIIDVCKRIVRYIV
ncbi:hypothetical protein HMPREF1210_00155 [Paenisporosarcina sp. HGH0030]|uniref:hypothetical protein n=1 Tax=Paenisporosarcina sp. HGH0030 TaxID=1078085 RepID=UPI00034E00FD|nr:hypothetical protein [Paenisporosarcina sp. HGH0030]EPD54170.1 hypothetical protein HMPREF1210_00155 [Paenisporosarcina sp. HGH0030]